jgi:SAM-dependent methyltransferase
MLETDEQAARAAGAAIFTEDDVVASYHARPPYAPALYAHLLRLTSGRARALDLGCGTGKVARMLADHFDQVVALDPSEPMIAAGIAQDAGAHRNIRWTRRRGEDFDTDERFDLVACGSAIHWMDPRAQFPKLARWTSLLAVLGNDPLFPAPPPPCGRRAWVDFLCEWRERTGRVPPAAWRDPSLATPPATPHHAWMDLAGREVFAFPFAQSVEDFVASCHARISWPRSQMGAALAVEFDAALEALMRPYSADGVLELEVVSELTWGAPRSSPRG